MKKKIYKQTSKKETNYICSRCKFLIDKTKEFAKFIHYQKENEIWTEKYYHINCFRERLLAGVEVKKMNDRVNEILTAAERMMGIEKKEVIQV